MIAEVLRAGPGGGPQGGHRVWALEMHGIREVRAALHTKCIAFKHMRNNTIK